MAVQAALGSDIAMAFDECPPGAADRAGVERGRRAHRPLGRALPSRRARSRGQLRFGIVQGGRDLDAARAARRADHGAAVRRLRDRRPLGRRGARADVRTSPRRTAALLPATRPRYFMGIGDPEGILRVIGAGVDMFDCVLPTRIGAHRLGAHLGGHG